MVDSGCNHSALNSEEGGSAGGQSNMKDLYPQKHRDRLHFQNQCLKDSSGVNPRVQGLKMCAGNIALERRMSILAT